MVCLCTMAVHATAQTTIETTITSVSGRSIYLDVGLNQGVIADLRVDILEPGFEQQYALIIDVAGKSCRAELQLEAPIPQTGALVRLVVPTKPEVEQEPATAEPDAPKKQVPEHPPWKSTISRDDPEAPLLAKAKRSSPEERPTEIRGRIFNQIRYTHDGGGDRSNDYTFLRLGARVEVTNPFHLGGRLLFQGDIDHNGFDVVSTDDSDTLGRVERLSYAIGGHEFSPFRGEIGRFYSVYVPEIGLVDGVEGTLIFENNWRLGVGAGSYPPPFEDRDFGKDYGVHIFADYRPKTPGPLAGTLAYQQTWHEGAPDQNLLVARVNAKPTETLSIYGLALVNIYTSSDTVKGSGVELTQGNLNVRYTPDRWKGAAVGYTRTLYPEIDRGDFDLLPEDLLRDGQVDRVYVSAWVRATDELRLTARVNQWSDQSDDGYGGDVGFSWQEVWSETGSLRGNVYFSDGTFTDGVGARLRVGENYDGYDVGVQYDFYQYTNSGMLSGDVTSSRHIIRPEVGWRNGAWRYNFDLSYTFGDAEDSYALRSYIEYRF